MDIKARQEAATPATYEPGEMVFVDNGDGTARMLVTSASSVPRQVVGLTTAGTLARTGAQQSGAVKTGTAFFQKFTPTRDITLTQVTIQGLSVLSGSARIRVSPNDGSGTTELAGADASEVSGGITAPIAYHMTAGTPYIIGGYGASLSLTLSGGHTWDGLTQPDTALITSTPTSGGWTQEAATGAQMAFLFDVGGVPIRRVEAGQGLAGGVTGGVLTLNNPDSALLHALLDVRESTSGGTLSGAWYWGFMEITPAEDVIILGGRDPHLVAPAAFEVWDVATQTLLGSSGLVSANELGSLAAPVIARGGQAYRVGWSSEQPAVRSVASGGGWSGTTYTGLWGNQEPPHISRYPAAQTPGFETAGLATDLVIARLVPHRHAASEIDGLVGGGGNFTSGATVDRPESGIEGDHYYDMDLRHLWKWTAGAWMLLAAFVADVTPPTTTLIAIGDSITFGSVSSQSGGAQPAWPTVLAETRGWTLTTNAGIDGSTLTTTGTAPMVNRYTAAVPEGYDGQVFLMGGTNDQAGGATLGQLGSTDPETIYGALRVMVNGIMNRLDSRGHLTLITPVYRTNEPTRTGAPPYTLEQVRQAVRDEAARGARIYPGRVHLIDAGRDLVDLFKTPGNAYLDGDGLHPNTAGQAALGRYIAAHATGTTDAVLPPAPAIPAPLAAYDMQQGANAGTLYALAGPNGTVTGTWTAQGLSVSGGTGAQVQLGALRPTSGVMSLTVAYVPTGLSTTQLAAALGTTPSARGNYDTFGIGSSSLYPGHHYGFLFAAGNPSHEVRTPGTAGVSAIVTIRYNYATGTTTMFLNGTQVNEAVSTPILDLADNRLTLGYWRPETTGAAPLTGTIHWARVDADLTAAQVLALHTQIRQTLTARGVAAP